MVTLPGQNDNFFSRWSVPTPPTSCPPDLPSQGNSTQPSCGYQPSEQRWSPWVPPWIGKCLRLCFCQWRPNSWVVLVLCVEADLALWRVLMNPRRFSAVLMLNKTERTAWEVREERERAVWERNGTQMSVPVWVKFLFFWVVGYPYCPSTFLNWLRSSISSGCSSGE